MRRADREGGRGAALNGAARIFGGVETGGSWCVCALGRGPGELVAVEKFPTAAPEPTLQRILAFFAGRPAPEAVGVAAFGPIELDRASPDWGRVTTTPKPGWADAPVGPTLRSGLDAPVVLDTDVNAAAVGEARWGAGQDAGNLCYLTIGTGIGAGLLIDGKPLHGLMHPEAGHIRIPHDLRRDPFHGVCPFHGDCWEGLASGPALTARWGAPAHELPDDHPAWALEAEYVAAGILAISLIASPQRVIAGGGVMERGPLLGLVRSRLRELLGGYLARAQLSAGIETYLVAPALGDEAAVLGAIALASDEQLRRRRP